ncbi:hypothetical protein [Streptomyces sp. NPDC057966]|uniref:hypothetical protein n=1 Tax=Streptomyces sp. NPDC057966 TaxID=3346292 RepID=UPI0036E9F3CF
MTNTNKPAEGVSLVYQCRLDVSTSTIVYLADLLRSRLEAIRSPLRSQRASRIAVLVLAILRHDQRLLHLTGGNSVPKSAVRHRRDEMVDLLAARAPRLDRALREMARRGGKAVRRRQAQECRSPGHRHRLQSHPPPRQKQANRILAAAGRTPVGHGFAHLKAWRILTKLRTDPGRGAILLRALFVLTNLDRRSPLTNDLHPRHPRHPPNTSMTTPNAPHATPP